MDAISQCLSPQNGSTARRKLRAFVADTLNRNFLSGIIILLVVVLLWTASNFVTQDLYDDGYEKPFLVTYLNTSSFGLYLLPYCMRKLWNKCRKPEPDSSREVHVYQPLDSRQEISEVMDEERAAPAKQGPLPGAALQPLTTKETANLAIYFCILWFIANWSLNASLNYTTAASAMILASTSGFFTLGIGRLFHVETLTKLKLLAVVVSFLGCLLVYISDSQAGPSSGTATTKSYLPVLGDCLGLISAVFYAFYVILLKMRIGSESRIDMRLFFGFVGLLNTLFAWPVALLVHWFGIETWEWPPTRNVFLALFINMMITVSSDYLYVIAMLKTSPIVVTVGLSLTIPFTVVGDIILGHVIHTQVILGALLVMGSFVLVGVNSSSETVDD